MATAMATMDIDSRLGPQARKFLKHSPNMLIDGKLIEAVSGKRMPVYNPSTGNVFTEVRAGTRGPCLQR
jgi:hypothetical protein